MMILCQPSEPTTLTPALYFCPVDLSDFGSRLRAARESANISREKLAATVGLSKGSIRNYEVTDTEPSLSIALSLAKALGKDATWLDGDSPGINSLTTDTAVSLEEFDPGLPKPYEESVVIPIYSHVRASAGETDMFGWEPTDEDVFRLHRSKKLFAELLGFWPPDDMRGIRVDGWSMKRNGGGIDHDQIILYRPVSQIVSGARHVLAVSEAGTGEPKILVKRVQEFTGGGLKLISDNPALGIDDELLIPTPEGLLNQTTRQHVHLGVLGRVVWPSEGDDEATIRAVTKTIDGLIARGYLPSPQSS